MHTQALGCPGLPPRPRPLQPGVPKVCPACGVNWTPGQACPPPPKAPLSARPLPCRLQTCPGCPSPQPPILPPPPRGPAPGWQGCGAHWWAVVRTGSGAGPLLDPRSHLATATHVPGGMLFPTRSGGRGLVIPASGSRMPFLSPAPHLHLQPPQLQVLGEAALPSVTPTAHGLGAPWPQPGGPAGWMPGNLHSPGLQPSPPFVHGAAATCWGQRPVFPGLCFQRRTTYPHTQGSS